MDRQTYFVALSQELSALEDRVRDLMDDPHWLTVGEWKESVVRSILKRHLPVTAIVSRGFVISGAFASKQIDILIHDATRPVLFRDGDLVFVTPDAVLGVIEVKSRLTTTTYREAVQKLCLDIGRIRQHSPGERFAGLFAFESEIGESVAAVLEPLAEAAEHWDQRLDFAACGRDVFVRYWDLDPVQQNRFHRQWHGYKLSGMAAGYFVHNVIEAISPNSVSRNPEMWFPADGKESNRFGSLVANWAAEDR